MISIVILPVNYSSNYCYMRKVTSHLCLLIMTALLSSTAFSQEIQIQGHVKNSATSENVGAVSVIEKGTNAGTYTDDKGNFSLKVKSLPVTLIFSSVSFETQEIKVSSATQAIDVSFVPSAALGQDIVLSASRVPQKIMESPVTIERISSAAIRNAPAPQFYDVVATLKGVDVSTSSLTFSSPTTRGFGGSGNVRFNQLVDGMDNQAPGLNFSVGSIIGLNELDIDNIELLSGASSALYGSGGMNGTLLMTSKSPFKYQGFSFSLREGLMHADARERPASAYHNWALRWAKKVNDRFAFKITSELIQGKDWIGMDYRDYDRNNQVLVPGSRSTDPNYDGVNVYGDETTVNIVPFLQGIAAQAPFLAPFISTLTTQPINVSRTGYTEQEILNPNTLNFKLGGSVHYKITENTEAILAGYWGTGNTVYTGASRYSIKDFKMGQYKLELANKYWNLRFFTTQENAGETYNMAATTQNFNEAWKPSVTRINGKPVPQLSDWYVQYSQAYLQGMLNGLSNIDAHNAARALADVGRPKAGTPEFNSIYNKIRMLPVPEGGLLLDRSDLYQAEGNYNLSRYTSKVADVIVGAVYKRYVLDSEGTLFADKPDSAININEFGFYAQATRKLLDDRLTLQASGRFDKNENFEGRFTPRVTAVVKVAENNNIRLSYQTAYRFPSTQQQWINLDLNSYMLIGGVKDFIQIHHFDTNPIYNRDSLRQGKIVEQEFGNFKAESLTSFEAGYKGLLLDSKLLIDLYGYYGDYTNFTGRTLVVQSKTGAPIVQADADTGQLYSIPINSKGKVGSWGWGLGVDYRMPSNFTVSANVASDNLERVPAGMIASFNSPKYKANISLSNTGFGKGQRMGFMVAYRWQDNFYFQGDLANGEIPSVRTVDAQISYKFPKTKSILKLGATNLLNQYYYNAVGNSFVGGLYYLGFGYNVY